MDPEGTQGGGVSNILTDRFLGIPGYIWLIGIAVGAYLLFFRNSSSSATPESTGGGGTVTTGNTTIDKGAIQIKVTQQPQQKPPPRKKTIHTHPKKPSSQMETASGGADLNKLARQWGTSEQALLSLNPGLKSYYGTGQDIPKGTKIKVPVTS